jgi:adenylate cyclase
MFNVIMAVAPSGEVGRPAGRQAVVGEARPEADKGQRRLAILRLQSTGGSIEARGSVMIHRDEASPSSVLAHRQWNSISRVTAAGRREYSGLLDLPDRGGLKDRLILDGQATADADAEVALAKAEREGLRVALLGRTAVLGVVALWFAYGALTFSATALLGLAITLAYLAAGLVLLAYVQRGGSRIAVYAFTAAELIGLGLMAATLPLAAAGDVPQIMVFRAYNVGYFLVLVAVGALSLSPGLVLWSGFVASVSLWAAFGWIVSTMEHIVSWRDYRPGSPGSEYVRVVLDPAFVGMGNRVEETIVILVVSGLIAYAVHRARGVVRARSLADAERRRALEVFGQYVPPDVALALIRSPAGLAPRALEGSVLFGDIASFTRFSETRTPDEVIQTMTEVFETATVHITRHGGIVAGFAGDAIVAAFTFSGDASSSARGALSAARDIERELATRVFFGASLAMRIGISSGEIAAGSVGGTSRRAYTVYGDPVNLAQRLQELAKGHGRVLMICDETWRRAGSPAEYESHGSLTVRGRERAVEGYAPTEPPTPDA